MESSIWSKWAPELSVNGYLNLNDLRNLKPNIDLSLLGFDVDILDCVPTKNQSSIQNLTTSGCLVYLFGELLHWTFYQESLMQAPQRRRPLLKLISLYLNHDQLFDNGVDRAQKLKHDLPSVLKHGLHQLNSQYPHIKPALDAAVQAELESVVTQYSDKFDLPQYLRWTEDKGGYLAIVIGHMLDITGYDSELYQLGAIIQHVDDLIDFEEDSQANIYTYVRRLYDIDHSVDKLVYIMIQKLNQLPNKFNIFKVLLTQAIIYAGLSTHLYSTQLQNQIRDRCYIPIYPSGYWFKLINNYVRRCN